MSACKNMISHLNYDPSGVRRLLPKQTNKIFIFPNYFNALSAKRTPKMGAVNTPKDNNPHQYNQSRIAVYRTGA